MILTNWVYLAVGAGLGIGVNHWWNTKLRRHGVTSVLASSRVNAAEVSLLLQQLKQTQIAYWMASQISQFKAGFLARTSHELRSPLNGLIGAHQLILAGLCDSPAEEREFLAQANESAMKLVRILDNIITVSKTEYGSEEIAIQTVQLGQILDELEDLTHLLAENRNFALKMLSPDPEIYIQADRRRLIQALVSIIDGAISEIKEGGISISTQASPLSGCIDICIDATCPITIWNEPVDLLQQTPVNQKPLNLNPKLSPGMNLMLAHILLEMMGVRLVILPIISEKWGEISRFQCSLPLALPRQITDSATADCAAPLS